MPEGLIDPADVPAHAGLIYFRADGEKIRIVKNARLLHKRPAQINWQRIAQALSWRENRLWKARVNRVETDYSKTARHG